MMVSTWRVALLLSVACVISACSPSAEETANKLFVETQQQLATIDSLTAREAYDVAQAAERSLQKIVSDFPESTLAVALSSGGAVGSVSVASVGALLQAKFAETQRVVNAVPNVRFADVAVHNNEIFVVGQKIESGNPNADDGWAGVFDTSGHLLREIEYSTNKYVGGMTSVAVASDGTAYIAGPRSTVAASPLITWTRDGVNEVELSATYVRNPTPVEDGVVVVTDAPGGFAILRLSGDYEEIWRSVVEAQVPPSGPLVTETSVVVTYRTGLGTVVRSIDLATGSSSERTLDLLHYYQTTPSGDEYEIIANSVMAWIRKSNTGSTVWETTVELDLVPYDALVAGDGIYLSGHQLKATDRGAISLFDPAGKFVETRVFTESSAILAIASGSGIYAAIGGQSVGETYENLLLLDGAIPK